MYSLENIYEKLRWENSLCLECNPIRFSSFWSTTPSISSRSTPPHAPRFSAPLSKIWRFTTRHMICWCCLAERSRSEAPPSSTETPRSLILPLSLLVSRMRKSIGTLVVMSCGIAGSSNVEALCACAVRPLIDDSEHLTRRRARVW
jgi:hypothetical protein